MALVKEVISLMDEIAPLSLSDLYCKENGAYDNSGLIIGNEDRHVFTVLCCLDVTSEVALEAVDINAEMIISHHPIIYGGIKNILQNNPLGKTLYTLIKNDISVLSAHLNLDVAPYGINQLFADQLDLTACTELMPINVEDAGLGRVGKYEVPKTLSSICAEIEKFSCTKVSSIGDLSREITVVAVACGACGGDEVILQKAVESGAELFITSEIKHHIALLAKELGICVIDAGHYGTEYFAMPLICELLNEYADERQLDIEFIMSEVNTNPFNV